VAGVDDGTVQRRLRLALREALRARDMTAASALRSALAAIGNAQAVPPGTAPPAGTGSPRVAGAAAGVAAAEAERRSLSDAEAEGIVRVEITQHQAAARDYERAGHAVRAGRLRREADVLMSALNPGTAGPPGPQ
jgi:uncharacterized protein YqeY